MQVTINISSKVQEVFGKHLQNLDSSELRRVVIGKFLTDILSEDSLDLAVGQYLDYIEESGELLDIIEEVEK